MFPKFVRLAVVVFWVLLPVIQVVMFRDLRKRGAVDPMLVSQSIRDHVIGACLRGMLTGLGISVPVMIIWGITSWPTLGWRVLLGFEILLALLLLAVGLAAVSGRLALEYMTQETRPGALGGIMLRRGGILGVGILYGSALWWFSPASSTETLIAVFVLGVATTVFGLNRLGEIPHQNLTNLSGALRKSRL